MDRTRTIVVGTLAVLLLGGGCYQSYVELPDGEHEAVAEADAAAEVIPDGNDDTGTVADTDGGICPGGWYDLTSGLCWQDPPGDTTRNWDDAMTYCAGLVLGGSDDWHLPTISELRSFIRGHADTMAGGACGVTDECLDTSCAGRRGVCRGSTLFGGGPGTDGAYWPEGPTGIVDRYWSSSECSPGCCNKWTVSYGNAGLRGIDMATAVYVRCVRPGP